MFLGLDCGGSSCRAMAVDEEGIIRFEGRGGPANWASTRRELLLRELWSATNKAPSPDIVCACFAGLMSEEDRIDAEMVLASLFPEAKVLARPDYYAAIEACPEDATACVISGTGSLVCSKYEGEIVRSGGKGYLIGDRGSAFAYGIRALRHFIEPKGGDVSPQLAQAIDTTFGTLRPDSILATLYRGGSPTAQAAELAHIVPVDAEQGHGYAIHALETQSTAFGEEIVGHLRKYHGDAMPWIVYLAGGLWEAHPAYFEWLVRKTNELTGGLPIEFRRMELDPLEGAVRLAMDTFYNEYRVEESAVV